MKVSESTLRLNTPRSKIGEFASCDNKSLGKVLGRGGTIAVFSIVVLGVHRWVNNVRFNNTIGLRQGCGGTQRVPI